MLSLNTNRLERYAHNWIVFGFFVYLGAFFLLEEIEIMRPYRIFVMLPVVVLCIITRLKCIQDKRALFICAIFFGYLSLSALWGEGRLWEATKHSFYILCLMLSVATFSQRFSEETVVKFLIGIGLIAAITYIAGIFLSDRDVMDFFDLRFSFHEIGGWGNGNPINSGIIIGIPAIAAWYFFPNRKWHIKLMLTMTIILCAILMFVTKSRGPMISVVITLLCIVLFRRERGDFFLVFLFAVLIGAAILYIDTLDGVIINRFKEENYRLFIWREGWNLFIDHWSFGQGYKTDAKIIIEMEGSHGVSIRYAHNSFIEILRVGGIVGGVLFFFMLGSMLRLSHIHFGNRFYLFWLFFGILCLSTTGRLPLSKPTAIEAVGFWIPLFLFYFLRKPPVPSVSNVSATHEKTGEV